MASSTAESIVDGVSVFVEEVDGLSLWAEAYLKLAPRKIAKFVLSTLDCFVAKTGGQIVTVALYCAPDSQNQRLYVDYDENTGHFVAELIVLSENIDECKITAATILNFSKVQEVVESWSDLYE